MSTKATLAHHHPDAADEPSWHLCEEVFEAGVVYLELEGVSVKLRTRDQGGVDVVVRLPIGTARQLGLHTCVPPNLWAIAGQRGSIGKPDEPVPVENMTRACAAACVDTPSARVEFDPARGLLVGTFEDGVIIESGDPCELAERMFAHGARHGHVSMPDWREGDTAPASGMKIAFHARLNELGRNEADR